MTILGWDGYSTVCIGDVLPGAYDNPGLQQRYQCHICKGFIARRTLSDRVQGWYVELSIVALKDDTQLY